MTFGTSLFLIALGAILEYAVTATVAGARRIPPSAAL
jgi:hypothetical protein